MNASCPLKNPWLLNGYRAALARSSYPEENFALRIHRFESEETIYRPKSTLASLCENAQHFSVPN
jgi:hypothetical protein